MQPVPTDPPDRLEARYSRRARRRQLHADHSLATTGLAVEATTLGFPQTQGSR